MELTVGAILEGKVKSITNFGAFISLPEGKTGMVHISEVANAYVSDIRQYLTENQDKVRAMLKDQPWGYGAPDPTVKQAVHLSRTRTETVQTLEMLCSVLRKRINDIDDNPYWQRLLCVSWDEIKGCDRCENCDECTEFRRIPPQHCARCGRSFIERKENTFCPTCRLARKKKAQRHWCRVNGAQTRP